MTADVDVRSPCRMIWTLAGRPTPTDPQKGEGICALCGIHAPLHAKIGPNFTDYRRLAHVDGIRLCAACSWTTGGKPPRTLRMWTVVARLDQPAPTVTLGDKAVPYVAGMHLLLTNRRDMRPVAAVLADPPADGSPWLAAVAESGQKHCVPFTPINRGVGAWTVVLDGADVTSTPAEWRHILTHVAVLRRAGFSAVAIDSGQPPIAALKGDGLRTWQDHHRAHLTPYTDTLLLHLVNLMITKETVDDYTRTYPA